MSSHRCCHIDARRSAALREVSQSPPAPRRVRPPCRAVLLHELYRNARLFAPPEAIPWGYTTRTSSPRCEPARSTSTGILASLATSSATLPSILPVIPL